MNADLRKLNANKRRFNMGICDYLRAIRGNSRSQIFSKQTQLFKVFGVYIL